VDEVDRTPEQVLQEKLALRQAARRLMEHLHFKASHPALAEAQARWRLKEVGGAPMASSDSQRHSGLSATQMEQLLQLSGSDPVLKLMFQLGYPLDRETYIALNWVDGPPKQDAEFELDIPEPFRRKDNPKPPAQALPCPVAQRPVPGGPPMRAPDGHMYVYAPHAGGLYQRVVLESPDGSPIPWRSEEELVRALMRDHPGLTEEEARRDLDLSGG
jgi:hypothetical protein